MNDMGRIKGYVRRERLYNRYKIGEAQPVISTRSHAQMRERVLALK